MHFNLGTPPPTDVTAVQDGPTSITVTWTPPSPLDGITGYTISYTGGGSNNETTVSGGNTMGHTLTGLTNGENYTISIVGTTNANGLSSPPVQATVSLGMFHICCQCYECVQFSTIALCSDSVPQFHQLQSSTQLQQSLPILSPSPVVFPVAQW